MRDFALTAALVNLLGDEGDAAGLPPEPLIGWYTGPGIGETPGSPPRCWGGGCAFRLAIPPLGQSVLALRIEPSTSIISRGTESLLTLRWREADSNHQSLEFGDRHLGRMICCSR